MTHGQLTTPFVPTGSGTTLSITYLYTPNGAAQTLLSGSASAFDLSVDASDVLSFNLLSNIEIDGVAATSGVTVLDEGWHTITGDVFEGPVSYRYYRIFAQSNNGDAITGFQEIELATAPADTDITSPGMTTDSNSEFSPDFDSGNAINNDFTGTGVNSFFAASGNANEWWSVDLGSAFAVVELRMWAINDGSGPGRAPNTFDFEGSNNGFDWDVINSYSGVNDWSAGGGKTFAVSSLSADIDILAAFAVPPVQYSHFRIFIHSNNGDPDFSSIQEVEVATTPSGTDITVPGMTTSRSSAFTGRNSENIISNTFTGLDSWASSAGLSAPSWVSVNLGFQAIFAELRIWAGDEASGPGRAPNTFDFEGSNNGSSWDIITSFSNVTDWVQGESKTFDVTIGGLFGTQFQTLILTDPLSAPNSIHIDASRTAATMPNDPDINNELDASKIGDWISLHPTQPYVPLLKGGETPGRTYSPDKYESYNGDFTGSFNSSQIYQARISVMIQKETQV